MISLYSRVSTTKLSSALSSLPRTTSVPPSPPLSPSSNLSSSLSNLRLSEELLSVEETARVTTAARRRTGARRSEAPRPDRSRTTWATRPLVLVTRSRNRTRTLRHRMGDCSAREDLEARRDSRRCGIRGMRTAGGLRRCRAGGGMRARGALEALGVVELLAGAGGRVGVRLVLDREERWRNSSDKVRDLFRRVRSRRACSRSFRADSYSVVQEGSGPLAFQTDELVGRLPTSLLDSRYLLSRTVSFSAIFSNPLPYSLHLTIFLELCYAICNPSFCFRWCGRTPTRWRTCEHRSEACRYC